MNNQTDEENRVLGGNAKLSMPASIIDFLLDHYGLFDLVEVNMMSLYILNTLGRIEEDGFKFGFYKQKDDKTEAYQLDIHELISSFRVSISDSIKNSQKTQPKDSNEKNCV